MKNLKVFGFLITLFVLFSTADAQGLHRGAFPVKTDLSDFSEAFCSELDGDFRVCKVRLNDDGDAELKVLHKDKIVYSVKASFWAGAGIEATAFWTFRGDMDNDGSREIIIVSSDGISNGIAISYATAHIISDPIAKGDITNISFQLEEFGPNDNFIYNKKTHLTDILITFWDRSNALDPKRGWGNYLFGKWFRYKKGKIGPILNRQTMARRFLLSFAAERDLESGRRPYKWLSSRSTHRFLTEPMQKDMTLAKDQQGTVIDFAPDTGVIKIECTDGTIFEGTVHLSSSTELTDIESIGFWKSKYRLPKSLNLLAVMDKVEGQRVRVRTYLDEFHNEFAMIWFLDR